MSASLSGTNTFIHVLLGRETVRTSPKALSWLGPLCYRPLSYPIPRLPHSNSDSISACQEVQFLCLHTFSVSFSGLRPFICRLVLAFSTSVWELGRVKLEARRALGLNQNLGWWGGVIFSDSVIALPPPSPAFHHLVTRMPA